ncbi:MULTISPECIES: cupredoxin domain-containing protein [unclassified Vibrio]|uniref:Cupredoxin domain-containing protein n=1 Tax=Vibrio sp. HB236076 TaxID=3232307 RepID=A0AB39HJP5_9VIBR|nr:cupredoxin domain-containing protein [Vibrio sp. HB161653]MDP5255133.1 cupredoxin domain-containing protein [Vibrio sp. HB161653]
MSTKFTSLSLFTLGCLISVSTWGAQIDDVKVSVNDRQCEPMNLHLSAGKHRFIITNQSMRSLEWEILDGVRVVAERENIAPGFYQKMTVDLEPGEYQTTCGLLTNPQGKLIVDQYDDGTILTISNDDRITANAELSFYLVVQSRTLTKTTTDINGKDYYTLLTLSPMWDGNVASDDFWQEGSKRTEQLEQWKNTIRENSFSVEKALLVLSRRLQEKNDNQTLDDGIEQATTKVFALVEPFMSKVAPQEWQMANMDFQQWREKKEGRAKLAADLSTLASYFSKEG